MRKRVVLSLLALTALAACRKNSAEEVRWLETSEKKETIIFKDRVPAAENRPPGSGGGSPSGEGGLFFQFRNIPQDASYPNPSGLYFYELREDSILFRNNGEKYYFHMAADGKSFTIGRFFPANGTRLPEKLVFEKQ